MVEAFDFKELMNSLAAWTLYTEKHASGDYRRLQQYHVGYLNSPVLLEMDSKPIVELRAAHTRRSRSTYLRAPKAAEKISVRVVDQGKT